MATRKAPPVPRHELTWLSPRHVNCRCGFSHRSDAAPARAYQHLAEVYTPLARAIIDAQERLDRAIATGKSAAVCARLLGSVATLRRAHERGQELDDRLKAIEARDARMYAETEGRRLTSVA